MVLPEKGELAHKAIAIEPELPVREAITSVVVPGAPPTVERLPLTPFEVCLALVSLLLGGAVRSFFKGRTRGGNRTVKSE